MEYLSPEQTARIIERVIKREICFDTIVEVDTYHGEVRVSACANDMYQRRSWLRAVDTARVAIATLLAAGLLDKTRRHLVTSGTWLDEPPPEVQWRDDEGLIVG